MTRENVGLIEDTKFNKPFGVLSDCPATDAGRLRYIGIGEPSLRFSDALKYLYFMLTYL
jgi:hypothetical protein